MVANVFEIPATWLGDYSAILATATTLDRPTELGMLEKQERWREVLIVIASYVLKVSQGAVNGKLVEKKNMRIVECARKRLSDGRWRYIRLTEQQKKVAPDIQVKVDFPAIREGDMPAIVNALVAAMTLNNKSGTVVGIDERAGVGLLSAQVGIEDYGDLLEEMYPEPISGKPGRVGYDPDRTKPPPAPPAPRPTPQPVPGAPPVTHTPPPAAPPGSPVPPGMVPLPKATEAASRLLAAVEKLKRTNGRALQ